MATLSDFRPWIEKEVPGCGMPEIDRAARDAIIRLCELSRWWQDTLAAAVPLADGTTTYTLTPPADAEIIVPVKAWIVDVVPEIKFRTREWLDSYFPGWDYSTVTRQRVPYAAFVPAPGKVRFYPPPNADSVADGLEVSLRAALKPAKSASNIDARFLDDAPLAVRAGALATLLDTRQPWGNINRARQEETRFLEYVGEFTTKVATGGGPGILTARTSVRNPWV